MSRATGTEVKNHQDQLARLQSEVEALQAQIAHAHRLATVGTLTAMVAHEFNNLLTPIINYARMARKDPALVDKALTRIAEGGTRASNICQALLGMARDEPGEAREARLADLVAEMLDAMARRPEKDCIELKTDIPADLMLTTRPVELQQVLLNLLLNARMAVLAADGPRRIELSARKEGDHVLIRVSDSGVGISPQDIERIFQPFFSAKCGSDGGPQGHGLGLAFCRKIVVALGGDISVESSLGRGTTFTIRLPS